jgi:hypothetical protein
MSKVRHCLLRRLCDAQDELYELRHAADALSCDFEDSPLATHVVVATHLNDVVSVLERELVRRKLKAGSHLN